MTQDKSKDATDKQITEIRAELINKIKLAGLPELPWMTAEKIVKIIRRRESSLKAQVEYYQKMEEDKQRYCQKLSLELSTLRKRVLEKLDNIRKSMVSCDGRQEIKRHHSDIIDIEELISIVKEKQTYE